MLFFLSSAGLQNAFSADASDLLKSVQAPPEFEVTVFAVPPEVNYPTCLAAAPTGELFVGVDQNGSLDARPQRGKVVRCLDTDGDGKADRFNTFAEMDSPRGLWFDNNTLYVMHPPFVTAFYDENGDGTSDRSEVLVKGLGFDLKFRGADHTVNGMRMAIDGWLYIAVGDYGAIKAVGKDGAELQLHGGGVVRVRPDGSGLESVSRGQRNIYDVAVSPELDLFTRDNTNDGGGWDVRLSHVIMSGYYGYPSHFKNFADEIIQPLADYGGGSPCGSLFLDEPGFRQQYGTTLYTVEWGRSAVFRHPLDRNGASFKAGQERFVELPRPTDMDVDGQSHLYISSWAGGNFNYAGPNVGFVVRVTPKGTSAPAFPDLAKAKDGPLLEELKSPSAVRRLHVQREILRRGRGEMKGAVGENTRKQTAELVTGLEKLAVSDARLAARIAAIFTLKQLAGAASHDALLRFVGRDDLREFALRALADNKAENGKVALQPFVNALSDLNPRVRLQAVVALGRLEHQLSGRALVPLLADADPLVAHATVQSLIALRASEVCLAAFDSSSSAGLVAGASRVLQSLHEPAVVEGLIERLGKVQGTVSEQAILKVLCRLYQREADWDGRWWGTCPDTSGPYFKPAKWEASDKIEATLRNALNGATAERLRWLAVELQKNKVDLPELMPMVLKLAGTDASFRAAAVDLFADRSALPEGAIGLLREVAVAGTEEPGLRVRALRALLRTGRDPSALDAGVDALAVIGGGAAPGDEATRVWDEFTRDARHGRNIAYFLQLAEAETPAKRLLGYCVLLNVANQRSASKETKTKAAGAVEQAWGKPQNVLPLLAAVARTRADQYAYQVRTLAKDARPEVQKAAAQAAERLGLAKDAGAGATGTLIETLPYEQVVATATADKGDARIGAQLFVKQGCIACHTVSADDAPKGPFLGGIAARYNRTELCESILKPSAKIAQGFETQWFKTKDGEEIEGFVTREGGDDLDLRNAAGITTLVAKKDIQERGKRETSVMPQGLADKLTAEELASLIAYLELLPSK